MLSDYFSEINDHGTVVPVKDLAAFPRSEQAVLGAKNLLPVPYYNGTSYENNGVTFTVDENGIVDADGTAGTGGALFYFRPDANKLSYPYDVIVSGLPSQGSNTTFNFGGTGLGNVFDVAGKTVSANTQFSFCIEIRSGYQCNHLKFKPLIRMASDPDSTYAPFAMTNKQLTDAVQGITVKKFTSAELTISAGQFSAQELNIANGDLIPLGVVGYVIGGNGNTDCTMWKNWMDSASKKVLYGVKNNGTATQATVTVDIFVLYKG